MSNEEQQVLAGIYEGIMSIFDEESSNDFHVELNEELDATMFFTQMVKASNLVFMNMTKQDIDHLEFTHIANRLIVQDNIESFEKKIESLGELE